ncbi:Tc toxin subunit A [Pseudescherichia vulneris]|uniref:Tc toxin subunit A n=1 Tax=Pseudescherichia vulneris TaxID=566 RepID=UPI001EDD7424|nr:Tc toxin subunit A [Pseudescherichia vulneris]
MTLSVSPALAQVETALKVSPGSFAKNNYHSVFDVARTSRKQFIADNMPWLGLRGGKAWDLALGQAQHIRRLFRESQLTRRIRQGLPQTLSGQPTVSSTSSNNIQGLVQNGPTWQNQFAENWQAYCQSSAPEATDSPVSYLTWLYQQATRFEEEIQASSTADKVLTLAERRPDLAALTVDNDAINQQIPTLQLVNEILESSIATVLPDGQSVDEALAETRYPTLLPYHFPHDQVELSLQNAVVPLEEIISQTATDWPWFLGDSWCGERSNSSTELASRLAPEQQTLVIEPDNSTASDLTSFYKTNLGLETTDYTPFEDFDMFTYQLGITAPQMEELIAGSAGGALVMASPNVTLNNTDADLQTQYGAAFINENASPAVIVNFNDSSADYILSGEPSFIADNEKGDAIRLASNENQYITIADDFTTINNTPANFSMGFWVNINSDPKGDVMVAGNTKISSSGRGSDYGFFILGIGSAFDLNITDRNGKNSHVEINFSYNEWNYVIFSVDWDNKSISFCKRTFGEGKDFISNDLDLSSLTVGLPELDKWYFNNDSGEDYYQRFSRSATIDIQEVAVWDFALTDDEMSAISASTLPAGGRTDMLKFYPFYSESNTFLNNLSDARMDRINRMVRLQRWLGLSYEETDLLLSACIHAQGENNSDYSLNAHTLRALGVFRHWQQRYGVSAFEFAAVLDVITPYAISPAVPFFDQVFNSPSLFDAPFAITGADFSYTDLTGDSARTVRQICAGLDITQAQFRVLADRVAAEQGDAEAKTLPLTLAVVSALYRLVMVPRWLGLAFADGAALLSLAGEDDVAWVTLAGVPQLSALTDSQPAGGDILDLLMALEAAAVWAADHKLSWVKNYLALQPETAAPCSSELVFSHTTLTDGKFSQSIQVRSAANSYFYFHPDGEVAQAMKGDKSFTLGFWTLRNNLSADRIPLFSNAGDANNTNYAPGFSLSTYNGANSLIYSIADNADKNVSDPWNILLYTAKWYYVALSWDAETRNGAWYTVEEKATVSSPTVILDASNLSNITTAEGFTWAFNTRGDLTRHSPSQDNVPTFIYEDLALFDGALSVDDINALVNSDKPVAETDLSGLSATCLWTLSLPPKIDALMATTATVNFVNGIKQQLPAALLSEQSFVAVPLPAGSDVSGWLAVFPYLIDTDGLVLATAVDYDTITTMVTTGIDAADITFATDADREQAVSTLSGIINQARLTQNGIADSALAQMFSTAQSLPSLLLSWAGDSEYRLLADSLEMNSDAALTDPAQVPASYLTTLFAVGQRAGISSAFSLTPATLSLFLAHPDWFGVSDTTLTLTLLYRFSRYADWLGVAGDEDRVLGYLAWVNGAIPPDATQAAKALALLLGWESSEVTDATAALEGGLAKSVTDVDYVMRLRTLSAETGLSVTPLLATGELTPGGVTDTWDAWQSAGESLVAAQSGTSSL